MDGEAVAVHSQMVQHHAADEQQDAQDQIQRRPHPVSLPPQEEADQQHHRQQKQGGGLAV